MKGFLKGCAVTALALGVVGIALMLAGGSMVGTAGIVQAVESARGGRMILDPLGWLRWGRSEIVPIEEGIAQYRVDQALVEYASLLDRRRDPIKGDARLSCPGEAVRKLELEAGGCEFTVVSSSDGNISLEVMNADAFQGYVEGDTLFIKSNPSRWNTGNCNILLYLPEGHSFELAEVTVGAGTLFFQDLDAEELSVEVGAGSLETERVRAEHLDLTVGAGTVTLQGMEIRDLEVSVGVGSLYAVGRLSGDADVECAMGSVEMALEGSEENFNYDLEGSLGVVNIGDIHYAGISAAREINNHAAQDISLESAMGSISIFFQ